MIILDLAKSYARDIVAATRQEKARMALRLRHPGALISRDVRIFGDPDRIELASGVAIFGPSSIVVEDGGGLTGSSVRIGEDTYVGEFANIRAAGTRIAIGARCLIAQSVTIVGSNHGTRAGMPILDQEWSGTGVEIGDDVWIASHSVVVAGARIGSGAVIAANSVVRGEVPPNAIMAGSPARQVGERSA